MSYFIPIHTLNVHLDPTERYKTLQPIYTRALTWKIYKSQDMGDAILVAGVSIELNIPVPPQAHVGC